MKIFITIITILSILTIILFISFLSLFKYGLKKINTLNYSYEISKYKNWDKIFKKPKNVHVKVYNTGYFKEGHKKFLNKKNPNFNKIIEMDKAPVLFFLIKHEKYGDILIDTGLDDSFSNKNYGNFNTAAKLFQKMNNVKYIQKTNEGFLSIIKNKRIDPKMILFTHLSCDHTSGLEKLNHTAEIIIDKNDNNFMMRTISFNHFENINAIKTIDFDSAQSIYPFDKTVDLLGDGSIWVVSTPGHSAGHMSFLINSIEGPIFIAGDACIDYESFKYGVEPFSAPGKNNFMNASKSIISIKEFIKNYPNTKLYMSHDIKN